MKKPFIGVKTSTAILLLFGLVGQPCAANDEQEWTELTIEEFENLVLGNTMKGRSSRENMRYVEYWKKKGRKIHGRSEAGEYSTRWRPGEDTCIMYYGLQNYQCWKFVRNEHGDFKWKRGSGTGDTYDVIILEGRQLSNEALFADD